MSIIPGKHAILPQPDEGRVAYVNVHWKGGGLITRHRPSWQGPSELDTVLLHSKDEGPGRPERLALLLIGSSLSRDENNARYFRDGLDTGLHIRRLDITGDEIHLLSAYDERGNLLFFWTAGIFGTSV